MSCGAEIRVHGLVQGVGFRPAVWHLAHRFAIDGEVLNDGAGVLIRAWGAAERIEAFLSTLAAEPPPLARISLIERRPLSGAPPGTGFRIVASGTGAITTGIVPDAAACSDCLNEIVDPSNRRYRYPFTNCTHCGPRLTIIRSIPYDRSATSMSVFPMCPACQEEYEDPSDRRFHAEPNACPRCGPRLWLEDQSGHEIAVDPEGDAISTVARLIAGGSIVAVKGIGGFHLACDATNGDAVSRLRYRKKRYHKPFALMARDIGMIKAYARVAPAEATLLSGAAGPIVILERDGGAAELPGDLAPRQATLGFMLPYTPLHHLLMRALDHPIVLTSGNSIDEPQCTGNEEARRRLAGIADFWLMNDRDIVNRLDDSVVRVVGGEPSVVRRARGYAPEPLILPEGLDGAPPILALGAELKSTFCLADKGRAIVSQHIGDLEDSATHADFRAAFALYQRTFAFEPRVVAVDCHPDYLSTKWGHALCSASGARLIAVQHHHAHIAAVLAEHGEAATAPPVLGIVLDGLGLGENGELWGGEFLCADYRGFERLAAFAPVPLIGGDRAMREPWRNAYAHLEEALGWDEVEQCYSELEIVRLVRGRQPHILRRMVETGLGAPRASSAGRLFDAIAAVLDVHAAGVSYEGQAAIEIEALAQPFMSGLDAPYPVSVQSGKPRRLTWSPFWRSLMDDVARGVDRGLVAARAHGGFIDAISWLAKDLLHAHQLETVVLSGGVFQNRLLLEGVTETLGKAGCRVLSPSRFPANDGGISLGQAAVAAARLSAEGGSSLG